MMLMATVINGSMGCVPSSFETSPILSLRVHEMKHVWNWLSLRRAVSSTPCRSARLMGKLQEERYDCYRARELRRTMFRK